MNKEKLLKNLNKTLGQEPEVQPRVQIFYPEKFLEILKNENKAFHEQFLKLHEEGKAEQAKEIAEYKNQIVSLSERLEEAIKSSRVDRVEVTNFDFPSIPEFPKFPKSFSIDKPKWYEKFNPKAILNTIKEGFIFQSKSFESALDRHKNIKNALAVRLVDKEGRTFYDAIATAYSTGANTSNLAKETTLQSLLKALTSDGTDSLDVNIIGGSSAGTQYTEGDTDATITGTALMWEDAANTLVPVSSTKPLPVSASIDTTGLALAANQQTDALTDTELRATPVPVSGTVTANLSATDNAVLDAIGRWDVA